MRLFYIIFISILRLSKCSNTCSDPDCVFSFPDCLDPIQVIFFYRIGFGKFPLIVYTGFSNDICIRTTCPVTGYFFFIITDRNLPKDQCISFFYRVARMYVGVPDLVTTFIILLFSVATRSVCSSCFLSCSVIPSSFSLIRTTRRHPSTDADTHMILS